MLIFRITNETVDAREDMTVAIVIAKNIENAVKLLGCEIIEDYKHSVIGKANLDHSQENIVCIVRNND